MHFGLFEHFIIICGVKLRKLKKSNNKNLRLQHCGEVILEMHQKQDKQKKQQLVDV